MEITANEENQETRKGASNTQIWSAETKSVRTDQWVTCNAQLSVGTGNSLGYYVQSSSYFAPVPVFTHRTRMKRKLKQ